MNRCNLFFALLLMVALEASSQTQDDALRDVEVIVEANLALDFNTIFKYTHPNYLEYVGGKENLVSLYEDLYDTNNLNRYDFEVAEIRGVSEIVKEQGEHRCVVEFYTQVSIANQRIKSKVYLLGIYNTLDQYWWFIKAERFKNTNFLKSVFPDFETSLKIPRDNKTVYKKD